MKKSKEITLKLFALCFVIMFAACAESTEEWNADAVCPITARGTFTDARDGEVYHYTTIGDQVWMAENLRFKTEYSECYDYDAKLAVYCSSRFPNESPEVCVEEFCKHSGRYYNVIVDQDEMGLLDRDIIDSICPEGWHVPTVAEWTTLAESVDALGDDKVTELKRIKSTDSIFFINSMVGPGTDECGFSSKYVGYKNQVYGNSLFLNATYITSTAKTSRDFYVAYFTGGGIDFFSTTNMRTIRCVKD